MKHLLTAAAALLLASCATAPRANITHVVVLWLKNHGNAADRAKVIETSESFRKIPGVLSVSTGPCIPSARPVVGSSFDVAISLTFATQADLQRYLDHPQHKAAAEMVLKPLVRKFTVFDFGGE